MEPDQGTQAKALKDRLKREASTYGSAHRPAGGGIWSLRWGERRLQHQTDDAQYCLRSQDWEALIATVYAKVRQQPSSSTASDRRRSLILYVPH